jgi:Flp pilus assembly CpaF family ATPase
MTDLANRPGTDAVTVPPALVARLRARVADRLSVHGAQLPDEQRQAVIAGYIAEELIATAQTDISANRDPLSARMEAALARAVRDTFTGLGGLQRLIDNPDFEDVFVNGYDNVWARTIRGEKVRLDPVAGSDDELVELIRVAAARSGAEERRFDRGSPALSLQLEGGQRLFAVQAVSDRPSLSIRRNSMRGATLTGLQAKGELTSGLRALLTAMVRAKKNVVICGGTGAGKTTLLRAMAAEMSPDERIVTVEDAFELGLHLDKVRHADCTALQQREPNLEGVGGIGMSEMLRWGLRMRPDRVIVGESRGAEAVPMLMAMSQGNDGSMCTIHASSSKQALSRLAMYVLQAPENFTFHAANILIGEAVDFVIYIRNATDGTRVISSIRQVLESDGNQIASNEIYRPGPDHRAMPGAPMRAETLDELIVTGLDPDALLQDRW